MHLIQFNAVVPNIVTTPEKQIAPPKVEKMITFVKKRHLRTSAKSMRKSKIRTSASIRQQNVHKARPLSITSGTSSLQKRMPLMPSKKVGNRVVLSCQKPKRVDQN